MPYCPYCYSLTTSQGDLYQVIHQLLLKILYINKFQKLRRYLFLGVFALVTTLAMSQPISDEELLTELEMILMLQEQGLTKIEAGLNKLEAGLTISEERLDSLESSFRNYEEAAETTISSLEASNKLLDCQVRVLTYGIIGTIVLSIVAIIAALIG